MMFALPDFIEACRKATQSPDTARVVHQIMSEAVADRSSIASVLGHRLLGNESTAQYVFLHQSPDLTILLVIVPGYLRSPPHNHLIWAVIGMYEGYEKNTFYRREEDGLAVDSERTVTASEVITLSPDIIHSISNPIEQASYALHVYGGTLANPARSLWNPFTLREEQFQLSSLLTYERQLNALDQSSTT